MSRPAEEILEFDRLRELLRRQSTCAGGRRAINALAFTTDRPLLEREFATISEAINWLGAGSEMGFGALADPEGWLLKLEKAGAVLAPAELLDAASFADTTAGLRETFSQDTAQKFSLLTERARSLGDFRSLAVSIRRAILPNGEISDHASAELRRIRGGIAQSRENISKTLERILRARGGHPGEDYVTRRNDRFVIPVRASERREVDGVVHASSATGQTVFVEPLETIALNNRLVQLTEDEAAEIARILEKLTASLVAAKFPLDHAASVIAEMDSLFARARFAREFDACLPIFTDTPSIALEAARHPVLESGLRAQGRAIVPMTLTLGGAETVLVISGPNTGGKTVALKTVGLAALAAQSGIPVAAQSARLAIFDRVLADIGDEQSIAADLSTFSAHMLNLKSMLAELTEQSLVLVDEMGTGTAPEEGAALAVALLDEFRARRCLVLATTHHDRLKIYASTATGVLNASVEFDEERLAPTYRLRVGVPGGSSGIAIARRLGLPADVIDRATALLTPEEREAAGLIAFLHRSREALETMQRDLAAETRRLEGERRTLREEWVGRQKRRIAELEKRFADALTDYEKQMAVMLEGIKDRELRAQIEKQSKRKLVEVRSDARGEVDAAVVAHLSESQSDLGVSPETTHTPSRDELVPGVRVRVRGLSSPVILRRCEGSNAEVEAGPLRMKIAVSEITAVVSDTQVKPPARSGGITVRTAAKENEDVGQPDEINVIGCTVEEATNRVDKFLDTAALAGKPHIRVIHGHGKGALRRGLADFFAAHPLVESIHHEAEERGGTAVTIIELKG